VVEGQGVMLSVDSGVGVTSPGDPVPPPT
jgi:hypothetical protein